VRSKVATATRMFMDEQGFLEVETPISSRSTPEGAREFLVPKRREPGRFLTRCPVAQQSQADLMVAGRGTLLPIARASATKTSGADRQLEFSQIDIGDVLHRARGHLQPDRRAAQRVWKTALNIDNPTPFNGLPSRRRSTATALIARYRFGMELWISPRSFAAASQDLHAAPLPIRESSRRSTPRASPASRRSGGHNDRIRKSLPAKGLAFIQGRRRRVEVTYREVLSDAEESGG